MAEMTNSPAETQGNIVAFDAIDIPFDWTNEDWALAHLPWVRAATIILRKDRSELAGIVSQMVQDGSAPGILEEIATTKVHLLALVDVLDTALSRQFTVLEELGYSPDLPPPSSAEMQAAN